jgi:hypothetical protein
MITIIDYFVDIANKHRYTVQTGDKTYQHKFQQQVDEATIASEIERFQIVERNWKFAEKSMRVWFPSSVSNMIANSEKYFPLIAFTHAEQMLRDVQQSGTMLYFSSIAEGYESIFSELLNEYNLQIEVQ